MILALTNCGFNLELETNCGTFKFITSAVGPTMSEKALPAFHALDDNTSFFSGSGKKSACAKWSTRPELTATLYHLMDKPETPSSDDIAVIESFVISLYSVSCILTDVNQTQQQIFAQSSRTFQYLQPTKAALVEHVERTTHQARASRVGSNLKQAGYHSGLPSLEPPKP